MFPPPASGWLLLMIEVLGLGGHSSVPVLCGGQRSPGFPVFLPSQASLRMPLLMQEFAVVELDGLGCEDART